MTKFTAYAALQSKERLQVWQYEPAPLEANEIEVKVTHNSLCHTDIHMRDNDWGVSKFPLVETINHKTKDIERDINQNQNKQKQAQQDIQQLLKHLDKDWNNLSESDHAKISLTKPNHESE